VLDLSAVTTLASGATYADLYVSSNADLTTVDLSGLVDSTHVDIRLFDNPSLTTVRLDSLQTGRGAEVAACPVATLSLPSLTSVDRLQLRGPDLVAVNLSQLHRAGQIEVVRTGLPGLSLPALVDASTLLVHDNEALEIVELPELVTVSADLEIHDNPLIASVSMPNLSGTGRLSFQRDDTLVELSMPAVTQTLSVTIEDLRQLTTLDLTSLVHIGPATTSSDGDLIIEQNATLNTLTGLSALTTIDDQLTIVDNGSLSNADAQTFAAGLSIGGPLLIDGPLP